MKKKILVIVLSCIVLSVSFFLLKTPLFFEKEIDLMNSPEKIELSTKVIIHWTGGEAYGLTDANGVGLVYGNIIEVNKSSGFVIVSFIPFDEKELKFAKVDLNSAKVIEILKKEALKYKNFVKVSVLFNK